MTSRYSVIDLYNITDKGVISNGCVGLQMYVVIIKT